MLFSALALMNATPYFDISIEGKNETFVCIDYGSAHSVYEASDGRWRAPAFPPISNGKSSIKKVAEAFVLEVGQDNFQQHMIRVLLI